MTTEWRDVQGFNGHYQVSDDGQVRSVDRYVVRGDGRRVHVASRILRPATDRQGYLVVGLRRPTDHYPSMRKVHRLVLESFVGPPPVPGLFGCHNDGNPSNNYVANLRWDTCAGNAQDTLKHGKHYNARKTACSKGHPYDADNTSYRADGGRRCRACVIEDNRIGNEKRRVKAS